MWIPMAIEGGMSLLQMLSKNKGKPSGDETGDDPYLSQIPGVLQQYYHPYSEMVSDPTGKLAWLGKGYKESPGYQFGLGEALRAGGQAAAAGGMAGSPMQQQEAQTTAQGLASQDYYKYMQNAMGMYQAGAQGYSSLGENLARNLMSESQLEEMRREADQKAQEQSGSDLSGLLGAGMGAIGSIFAKKGGSGW